MLKESTFHRISSDLRMCAYDAQGHIQTLIQTHMHTDTHVHTYTHVHTDVHRHAQRHTPHTYILTHTRAHTHTQSYTNTLRITYILKSTRQKSVNQLLIYSFFLKITYVSLSLPIYFMFSLMVDTTGIIQKKKKKKRKRKKMQSKSDLIEYDDKLISSV